MRNLSKALPMRRVRRIHFVGIGGSGMCGIAEVLLTQGYEVTGSDIHKNSVTERLKTLGATIYQGHQMQNVDGADVLVVSSAINVSNVEIIRAKELNIPLLPRAQMLAELMRFRYGIAVSGTHGKTTTTSLIASVLAEAGLDPTFVIGGRLNSAGANARLGAGKYLVVEADESDASFLYLTPLISVVTNIDKDHMDTYGQDFERLKDTFIQFLQRVPFYGLVVLCWDDPMVRSIIPKICRPMVTYGFEQGADCYIHHFSQNGIKTFFTMTRKSDRPDLSIELNLPGRHNVLNAAAAISIATDLGVPDAVITNALKNFSGVERRFQRLGDYDFGKGKVLLIDDYGHNPRKIEATIQAAKASYPGKRIVMIFQPHRYTRTRDLFQEFVRVLAQVDLLLLLDIYAASESPIPGITSECLGFSISETSKLNPVYVADRTQLREILARVLSDGDILISQGAGDVSQLMNQLMHTGC